MKTKIIFSLFIVALALSGCETSNSNDDGPGNTQGPGNDTGDGGSGGNMGVGNNDGAGNRNGGAGNRNGGAGNRNGGAGNRNGGVGNDEGNAGNNGQGGNVGQGGNAGDAGIAGNNGEGGNIGQGGNAGDPIDEPPTFCDAAGEGADCPINGQLGLCDDQGECQKCNEVAADCREGLTCSENGYCVPEVIAPQNPCEGRVATSVCALEGGNLGACPGNDAICATCSDADNPCGEGYACNDQNYCEVQVADNPCEGRAATSICALDDDNLGTCDGTNPACQNCSEQNPCADGFTCSEEDYCVIEVIHACSNQAPQGIICPLGEGNNGACPGENAECANCSDDNPCNAPFSCTEAGYCEVEIPDPCDFEANPPGSVCPLEDGNLGVCPVEDTDCAACDDDSNPCPDGYECTEGNYCTVDIPNPCDEIEPRERCLLSEGNYGVCPANDSDCAPCTDGEANPCPEGYICNASDYCIAENVDEPNPCDEIDPGERCLLTEDDYGVCPSPNGDCAPCTVSNENQCPDGYDCNPDSGYCFEEIVEEPDPCEEIEPGERCLLTGSDYGVCPADNSDCALCDDEDANITCPEDYECNEVGYCVAAELNPVDACEGLGEDDLCDLTADASGTCQFLMVDDAEVLTCVRCEQNSQCGAGNANYCNYQGYCKPVPSLDETTCDSYCYHYAVNNIVNQPSLCKNNPSTGSRGLFNPDQTQLDRGLNKEEQCLKVCAQYPTNQDDPNNPGNPIQNGDDSLLCRMNALRSLQERINREGDGNVGNNDRNPYCAQASPTGGNYCANPYKKDAEGNFDLERALDRTSSPEIGDRRACDTYCRTMERNCDGVYVSYGQCMAYCAMPYENIESSSYVNNTPVSASSEHYENWEGRWKNTDGHTQSLSCFINNAFLAGTEDPGSEGRNYYCESASFFDDPVDPDYDELDREIGNRAGCGYFTNFRITTSFTESVYPIFNHRKCKNCHGIAQRDGDFREDYQRNEHEGILDRIQEGVLRQNCTSCHNKYNPGPDGSGEEGAPGIYPDEGPRNEDTVFWGAPTAAMNLEGNREDICNRVVEQIGHILMREHDEYNQDNPPSDEAKKHRMLEHLIGDIDRNLFDPFIDWALDEMLGRIETEDGEIGNYNNNDRYSSVQNPNPSHISRPDLVRSYEARVRAWVEEGNMACP